MAATLYIVATPIGNLKDITLRAIEVLQNVDKIFVEDTRHTGLLLKHYQIATPLDCYNDINKTKKANSILHLLDEGKSIALACDAGTPGIADPAFYVVREAKKNNFPVESIPGACAAISALVSSGLPTDRFLFANFPAKKVTQQKKQLEYYQSLYGDANQKWNPTIIYYVSRYQVISFLTSIQQVLGESFMIAIARELTKKFEELKTKTVAEHLIDYQEKQPKGEFVFLFHFNQNQND